MKEMQANSVQHKVMIITVRIFFRNPVFFVIISKRQVSGYETGECIQFKLYSLNIFFRAADRHGA